MDTRNTVETQNGPERESEIELRAYYLWQRRGGPFGSPDVDWYQAEREVSQEFKGEPSKSGVVAVAELFGSALGSVAGIVGAVGDLLQPEEKSKAAGAE